MKLFLVHCGFYDPAIFDGIYEFHVEIPVAAGNLNLAKELVRSRSEFQKMKMHVDGVREIEFVDGYRVELNQGAEVQL